MHWTELPSGSLYAVAGDYGYEIEHEPHWCGDGGWRLTRIRYVKRLDDPYARGTHIGTYRALRDAKQAALRAWLGY